MKNTIVSTGGSPNNSLFKSWNNNMKIVPKQMITFFLVTMLFVSCRENATIDADILHGGMKVALSVSNPVSGTAGTATISKVAVYRFENRVLAEVLEGLVPDASGICLMSFTKQVGAIYCLANLPEKVTAGHFVPGVTSLDDFLQFTASDTEMASKDHITLMGSQDIFPDQIANRVPLQHTVARVDLSTPLKDVRVHRVKVNRIADRGFLNLQQDNFTPQGVQHKDSLFDFSEPLVDTTRPLLYLCEQENTTLEFEIYASFGGGTHKLKARLPNKIIRNRIYTLKVRGNGSKLDVEVQSADWNYGIITESNLEVTGLVDAEASVLPEGVFLNATRDTLRISPGQLAFDLALSVRKDAHVEVNGKAQGVTATVLPSSRTLQQTTHVSVTKSAKLIGKPEETIFLDILTDDTLTGRIVLIFEMHPVQLSGRLLFKNIPECDFGSYVEGELGVLTLPDGWTVSLSADTNEPWMKLMPTTKNPARMRILAGWRPNDPHADGRVQEAKLLLSDGTNTEEYTVRRQNWGLPVVNIDGTWWCKYNLRGNSIDFTDQILSGDDPVGEDRLYEHLQNCTEDELLNLLGHQYQGGYAQGLPLAWDASQLAFYYEGMRGTAANFATIADSLMVPPGYRLPRYEDYKFFSKSDNFNFGRPGSRTFRNTENKEIAVSISMRDVRFLGQNYGFICFYEFQVRNVGDRIVLCGLGHQFDTTHGELSRMGILFATKNSRGSWSIIGNANADGTGGDSRINFAPHNDTKTRTLRAIKEPVEYIY